MESWRKNTDLPSLTSFLARMNALMVGDAAAEEKMADAWRTTVKPSGKAVRL
jgi:hypothetical protein